MGVVLYELCNLEHAFQGEVSLTQNKNLVIISTHTQYIKEV